VGREGDKAIGDGVLVFYLLYYQNNPLILQVYMQKGK
jgi:hypothetical protein